MNGGRTAVEIRDAAEHFASAADLQQASGLKNRPHFLREYLHALLAMGWLERTVPDKPRHPRQRYRTTAAGRAALDAYVGTTLDEDPK